MATYKKSMENDREASSRPLPSTQTMHATKARPSRTGCKAHTRSLEDQEELEDTSPFNLMLYMVRVATYHT